MKTHVPLRSILLATNLSDIEWLFPYTCSLAAESGARITVLHVLSAINGFTIDTGCEPYYDPRQGIAAAKERLQAVCTRSCAAQIQSEVVVTDGTPGDAILPTASEVHADLLVMGTSGYRGLDKWLFGSVAETVLRSSSIPVITVGPHARPAAASGRPIKSIVFAVSLKAKSTDAENAKLTLKWAERLGARLTLLHVAKGDGKDKLEQERTRSACIDELRSLLPEDAFREGIVETQVRIGTASREILAAGAHADLIALGAVRNPFLRRFAPEGTLYHVLAEARCPVASLHSDHAKGKPA